MIIEPTVGRVVWYYPGLDFRGHYEHPNHPLAAHVAAVRENEKAFGWTLNVMVIDANGTPYAMRGVPLLQGDDTPGPHTVGSGYCNWMPYQKGQAQKTEELEAKLGGNGKKTARP